MVALTAARRDDDCASSFGVYVFGAHDAAPPLPTDERRRIAGILLEGIDD